MQLDGRDARAAAGTRRPARWPARRRFRAAGRAPRVGHGEAAHVQLVDHHVVPGHVGAPVVAPGEGRVDHLALGHAAGVVAPVEDEVLARDARADSREQCVAPAQRSDDVACVRIEQQLVRIEAVAFARGVAARAPDSRRAGPAAPRADSSARPGRCARAARCAAARGVPYRSNRQSSTPSACSEKSAKLTPSPSQFAPRGSGLPGQMAEIGGGTINPLCTGVPGRRPKPARGPCANASSRLPAVHGFASWCVVV